MQITTKKTLKIFWQHARKYRRSVFWLIVSMVAATGVGIYTPFWYKKFFDTLASGNPGLAQELVKIAFIVLGLNFVSWFFWRISTFVNNFFQPRVMSDILNTCFEYMHGHSYTFFRNNFVGSLVRR